MAKRMIALLALLFVACGSAAQQTAQQPATGTLDQMLAPIALYPDPLLAQMMMSAVDPAKVSELDQFLRLSTNLKGTELQNAAVKAGFDASYVALAIFPQVVTYMAQNIEWTRSLGQWFTNDRNALFDSIQRLRAQAASVGTLKSTPQQEVQKKTTESGQQVIVIEPTNPQIVYVPQYNPQVVYTQPPTTTVIVQEDNDADVAVAAGLIGFTAGIAIGAAMDNNYYYGPYGWHGGGYMYANAWDDYYDHREDAREDYIDHREDLAEERTDRRENTQEQRTDRQENRQESGRQATDAQKQQAQQRSQERQSQRTSTQGASTQSASTERSRTGSTEARGYSSGTAGTQSTQRSSDAFSGYSSGSSQRASSSRGQASRSSAASRGGASRSGGGRRR
ncbi:MAG TPA: DUF3300 domain-containing protein [Vicinamibacterales bacterium]|nr:DUF3300 domain-containing protein [Vicinamibacterales bacterium]